MRETAKKINRMDAHIRDEKGEGLRCFGRKSASHRIRFRFTSRHLTFFIHGCLSNIFVIDWLGHYTAVIELR